MEPQRLADELAALAAIFADATVELLAPEPELRGAIDASTTTTADGAAVSVALPDVRLLAELPRGYPAGDAPLRLALSGHGRCRLSRRQLDDVAASVTDAVAAQRRAAPDTEALLAAVQAAQEAIAEVATGTAPADDRPPAVAATAAATKHALVWFHHIMSPAKKRILVAAAADAGCVGLCKVGFPGALYLAGPPPAVDDVLAQLKALRWQAMVVRDEAVDDVEPGVALGAAAAAAGVAMPIVATTGAARPGVVLLDDAPGAMAVMAGVMRRLGREDAFKRAILRV
jgi:hypothetical protein